MDLISRIQSSLARLTEMFVITLDKSAHCTPEGITPQRAATLSSSNSDLLSQPIIRQSIELDLLCAALPPQATAATEAQNATLVNVDAEMRVAFAAMITAEAEAQLWQQRAANVMQSIAQQQLQTMLEKH